LLPNLKSGRNNSGMAMEDSLKLLAAILAATVLGVNLSIVRPLKDRMEDFKQEIVSMQSDMQLLVGERDQVRNTNDLLSGLKAQQTVFEEARHSLASMRQMREELTAECQKATEVLASVEKLAALQQSVLHNRDLTEPAAKALDQMVTLQKQLIEQNVTSDDAVDAANRLAGLKRSVMAEAADATAAEAGLSQLANLKTQILGHTENLATAANRTKALLEMKDQLLDQTADLDAANTAAEGLLALKDQMVIRGGNIADAQQNVNRLMGLRDRLAQNAPQTEAADRSATQLIQMQKKLVGEKANLPDALKSVETLIDIQHEFQDQVHSLDGIRRGLMEFVLMENTVARAVRTLQPLLELGNLRHLDDEQLQKIARSISAQQATRIGKNEPERAPARKDAAPTPSPRNRSENLDTPRNGEAVPWPTESK
jgi:hypothetical protein